MKRLKTHWKVPAAVILVLLLAWGLWYSRPVDIYTLGLGEPTAINVRISYAELGVGDREGRSAGAVPGDPLWETFLAEAEALRLRRPLWNLVRQYQDGAINTMAVGTDAHVVFYLWDSDGETLMIQVGAGKPCYTSRYTNENLPASLSGGEEAAQALAQRLWPLLRPEEP